MKIISATARVSPLADLDDSNRGSRLIVEDDVFIDSFVKVKFAGGMGDVIIRKGAYINSGCVIYSGHGVTIGAQVRLAANVVIAASDHNYKDASTSIFSQGYGASKGGVALEDESWIGASCVLLEGTVVGYGAVVGANSLVRTVIPAYEVWAGSPARRIGRRDAAPGPETTETTS